MSVKGVPSVIIWLTRWNRNKIADILHMTVSNTLACVKTFVLLFQFHWSLFLRILTIRQHQLNQVHYRGRFSININIHHWYPEILVRHMSIYLYIIMTPSNGNVFRVTGHSPVTSEFPAQRPVTRSFDVFFDLCLNKRLSKQSWGWWFETLPRPLWRHSNDNLIGSTADLMVWWQCQVQHG